jgi:hypothetical protein
MIVLGKTRKVCRQEDARFSRRLLEQQAVAGDEDRVGLGIE